MNPRNSKFDSPDRLFKFGGQFRCNLRLMPGKHSLGFLPSLHLDGPVDGLDSDPVLGHLLLAFREVLSNVARHAHARAVEVTVRVADGYVELIAIDDGVGMDPSKRRNGDRLEGFNIYDGTVIGPDDIAVPPEGGEVPEYWIDLGFQLDALESIGIGAAFNGGLRLQVGDDIEVVDPTATAYSVRRGLALLPPGTTALPGSDFKALLGTGHDAGRCFVEVRRDGKVLSRGWTEPGRTQWPVTVPVTESLRGGFTIASWIVRDGRLWHRRWDGSTWVDWEQLPGG